jgi:hypothetical protein
MASMAALGALLHAPVFHWWFGVLERAWPGARTAYVARKLALDMTLGVVCYNPVFLFCRGLVERCGVVEAMTRAKERTPESVLKSWTFLPWAQLVSFSIVPLHLRPPFAACQGFIMTTWLCIVGKGGTPGSSDEHGIVSRGIKRVSSRPTGGTS